MDYLSVFVEEKRLSLAAGTIKQYSSILDRFNREIGKPLENVTRQDIVKYLNVLLFDRCLSKTTVANEQIVIRCLYEFMQESGYLKENPCKGISMVKIDKKAPVVMTVGEVTDLMNVTEGEDTIMIELLYATGVRVSELVNVHKKDIDVDGCTIKVFGKGAKERIVLFTENLREPMKAALKDLQDDDLLFNVTPRTIQRHVKALAARAGIHKPITPHKVRHTMATHIVQGGGNVVAVQKLLGHNSLNTTQLYTHYNVDELKGMYNQVHPLSKEGKQC